jgi:rare lipoprotein A
MVLLNLRSTLIFLLIFGQLLSPVYTLPLQAQEKAAKSSTGATTEKKAHKQAGVLGVATYYAKRYDGKKTSSGHRYNPQGLTAASPSLPLGTRVRVINLSNSKTVVVTVNDRCRKRRSPSIDLSRAAAKQLGFLRKGHTRVRIIALNKESS